MILIWAAAFTAFLLGLLFIKLLVDTVDLPNKIFFLASLAMPFGLGIISVLMFYGHLIAGSNGGRLTVSLVLLLIAFLGSLLAIDFRKNGSIRLSGIFSTPAPATRFSLFLTIAGVVLCLYAVVSYWSYFWQESLGDFLGGWDARYFWNLKARFYFRDPGAWKNMFSPLLNTYGHPDYPLLLPGTVAWGWILTGRESCLWPILVGAFYSLSLLVLIFWYLVSYVSLPAALFGTAMMASIPVFRFWSTTQYADVPLTFYFTAAAILLKTASDKDFNRRLLLASGLAAGFSIWTKDEGYFFTLWILSTTGLLLLRSALTMRRKLDSLLIFILGIAAAALGSVIVKKFLGTTGGQFLGSGRSAGDFLNLLFGSREKSLFIAAAFANFAVSRVQWNGLWILFAFCCAATIPGGWKGRRWIFACLAWLVLGGYFVVIHLTPHELKFQIQTALLRLQLHAAPLALIFIMEAVSAAKLPSTKAG